MPSRGVFCKVCLSFFLVSERLKRVLQGSCPKGFPGSGARKGPVQGGGIFHTKEASRQEKGGNFPRRCFCEEGRRSRGGRVNVFFGSPECIRVLELIGRKSLRDFTREEDFILGIMLGYGRLEECRRYIALSEAGLLPSCSDDGSEEEEKEAFAPGRSAVVG